MDPLSSRLGACRIVAARKLQKKFCPGMVGPVCYCQVFESGLVWIPMWAVPFIQRMPVDTIERLKASAESRPSLRVRRCSIANRYCGVPEPTALLRSGIDYARFDSIAAHRIVCSPQCMVGSESTSCPT